MSQNTKTCAVGLEEFAPNFIVKLGHVESDGK